MCCRLGGLLLVLFSLALAVLANSETLRNATFAKMMVQLALNSNLDDIRCNRLGLQAVRGDVIEFGPGPGTNFRCFSGASIDRWVGVEPNEAFADAQDAEAAKHNVSFPRSTVWLRAEGLGEVDVAESSFDSAVLTHVLCSVDDPLAVLRQAARALRPGGKVYIMEHTAAPEGSNVRLVQQFIAPAWVIIANGCKFIDIPATLSAESGFGAFDVQQIEAPMPIALLRPHILATAVKGGAMR